MDKFGVGKSKGGAAAEAAVGGGAELVGAEAEEEA
jgi:hypothetical protein